MGSNAATQHPLYRDHAAPLGAQPDVSERSMNAASGRRTFVLNQAPTQHRTQHSDAALMRPATTFLQPANAASERSIFDLNGGSDMAYGRHNRYYKHKAAWDRSESPAHRLSASSGQWTSWTPVWTPMAGAHARSAPTKTPTTPRWQSDRPQDPLVRLDKHGNDPKPPAPERTDPPIWRCPGCGFELTESNDLFIDRRDLKKARPGHPARWNVLCYACRGRGRPWSTNLYSIPISALTTWPAIDTWTRHLEGKTWVTDWLEVVARL